MKNASPEKKVIFPRGGAGSGKALHRGLRFSSYTPDAAFGNVAVERARSLQTSGRSPQTSGCVLTATMARGVAVCGAVMGSSGSHPSLRRQPQAKPKYNLFFILSVLPRGKLFSKPT